MLFKTGSASLVSLIAPRSVMFIICSVDCLLLPEEFFLLAHCAIGTFSFKLVICVKSCDGKFSSMLIAFINLPSLFELSWDILSTIFSRASNLDLKDAFSSFR